MPDMRRDHAIVVYLPPEGPGKCYRLDIEAGWQAAQQICFPTIDWRKTTGLVQDISPVLVTTEPEPWQPGSQQEFDDHLDRTEWVRDRVQAIKTAGHASSLAALWSQHPEIPTFPKGGPRTPDELSVVVNMCDLVETQHGMPFGVSDPTAPQVTKSTRKQTA
jgi:hypothetical protein